MSAWPSRVVLLGASGHLGRALTARLGRDGVPVVGHTSKTLDLTRAEAPAALEGAMDASTALVFASALTPDRGQTPETFMANMAMVTNVAKALAGRALGLCVYVSSDAVYGFDVNPVTEATPVSPGGYYALAKYAGERVMEYAARAAGVPLLTLRVTGVYGPGDPHGAYGPNAFARSLAKDRSLRVFGEGEEERDHVYVDDVAAVVARLVRIRAIGVFNVATGESRPFADVVKAIRRLVPYEVAVTHAPRAGAITHRRFDTARLYRSLPGFAFTPLDEGLRATLASFGALGSGGVLGRG
ncbi:MAG TPA: NAD(P)-dependent oxidoreductase [Verrucomicrobiae bacterium]|nr:NAD(P)-dependent oxidoreductase [Verrucomicrobiae bacterium]